jgi:hypothetical protein
MSQQFHALKQDNYHRIAVGVHEIPCHTLRGSDIVLHLPVLEYFASKCDHVTEFGVREGCSTVALIAGCKGEIHSYDIEASPIEPVLKGMPLPCKKWEFRLADTGSPDLVIEETGLLFLDTLHTYAHLSKELLYHGRKAKRYLAFHDTYACGARDLSGPDPTAEGIARAIEEFVARYPGEYREVYSTTSNNGFLVLERVYP